MTPMFIGCRNCDGEMGHINFQGDICDPDYFPKKGMRVFIDLPEHFREVFKRRAVELNWENPPGAGMCDRFKTKQEALEELMDGEMQEGEPYVLQL